jgi:hypothetical protein
VPDAGGALREAVASPEDPADLLAAPEAVTLRHVVEAPQGCHVAVLGAGGSLRSLPAALSESWQIDYVDEVGDLTVADLVVLVSPTPDKIASVLARQPDASVVALAHPTARVDTVVELLHSGATACVRSGEPDLVAAHLVACARRYSVGAS